jgi:hypothetical protein
MKRLHKIRYPKNRAEAIRYSRKLDAEWASIRSIPYAHTRNNSILRLIKDVQIVLKSLENQKEDNPAIEASYEVIRQWLKRHWKGAR